MELLRYGFPLHSQRHVPWPPQGDADHPNLSPKSTSRMVPVLFICLLTSSGWTSCCCSPKTPGKSVGKNQTKGTLLQGFNFFGVFTVDNKTLLKAVKLLLDNPVKLFLGGLILSCFSFLFKFSFYSSRYLNWNRRGFSSLEIPHKLQFDFGSMQ